MQPAAEPQAATPEAAPDAKARFAAAMPKTEIGATDLLAKHPEYDGRGCIVAIFDTGVDPGAAGLATTPDGRPKIVDLVDGTGSGDVDMSAEVKADEAGVLKGLYGKELRASQSWRNPSGCWRVGAKALFELYPGGCKKRIQEKRKERWLVKQREALAAAVAELDAFKAAPPAPAAPPAATASDSPNAAADAAAPPPQGEKSASDAKERRKELEERVKLLEGHAEKYEDPGPMLHCVTWHDGAAWRAAIDTSDLYDDGDGERGLLADFEPMTNFRAERQYATFSALDACNFACNIYDDGRVLSIVTDTGTHGTHVAGITAAHHPECPALNGVAPGAQIVSCKIGDTRLGGMETGPGLVRALGAVLENKCDLINMSYGEPTRTPNFGRFVELAQEVVYDEGVIFVASAGNNGPGLTTCGAPGGTSECIISIGAYVSPALAAAGHAVRGSALPEGWAGQQYNWSSRGPTADGGHGVAVCAPGGAIAPVPQWSQQSRQLMNGTSMSSPNACGGVALLVSALKATGGRVTPARVRRALENTAKKLSDKPEDTLAYGAGLMQVHKAFEYLSSSGEADTPDVRYDVSVKRSDSQAEGRGIYLRDAQPLAAPCTFGVTVTPRLHRDADVRTERLQVEDSLELRVTGGAGWLDAPAELLLPHNGRQFDVRVDATGLQPGLHYAEVQGWDTGAEWRGPLFRVPCTICKPHTLPCGEGGAYSPSQLTMRFDDMAFEPGAERRHFVHVPEGASWCEITLRAGRHTSPKLFMVHTTQLFPHERPKQHRQNMSAASEGEARAAFAVAGGAGLEVAIAQFWKSDGAATLSVELAFHGVHAPSKRVVLAGNEFTAHLPLDAPLRRTTLAVKAELKNLVLTLRPTAAALQTQDRRGDTLPGGRVMHRLLLTYALKLQEGGSVTPRLAPLARCVYDGALEGHVYAVHDANKKRVAFGDVYPKSTKLAKGEYTIRVALRHDSVQVLEQLMDVPLRVDKALEKEVSVPVHRRQADAVAGEKPATKDVVLCAGERASFTLGPVPEDKWPKDAAPGATFNGPVRLAKCSSSGTHGDKGAPTKCSLFYTVPAAKARKDGNSEGGDGDEGDAGTSAAVKLQESRRDSDLKILRAFKATTEEEKEAYLAMTKELADQWPRHLPVFCERLDRAAADLESAKDAADGMLAERVLAAADEVLRLVDEVAVAQFIAWKDSAETQPEKAHKRDMKVQKDALLSALHNRCKAHLAKLGASAAGGEEQQATGGVGDAEQRLEAAYRELCKWADAKHADYVALYAGREERRGRIANAITALDGAMNDKDASAPASKALREQKLALLRKLGWHHWARLYEASIVQSFPADFVPL